jgi:hypothetical protein
VSSKQERPSIPPPIKPLPTGIVSALDLKQAAIDQEQAGVDVTKLKEQLGNVSPETLAAYVKGGVKAGETVKIEDLPEDQRGQYEEILNSSKDQLLESPPVEAYKSTNETIYPTPAEVKHAVEAVEKSATDTEITKKKCPHCQWDLNCKDPIEVIDEDRKMFVRHLLSGDRFIKRYSLANGSIVVTLRSRLQLENDLIASQTKADLDFSRINQSMYFGQFMRYMLACSLKSIQFNQEDMAPEVRTFPEVVTIKDGESIRKWQVTDEEFRKSGINDVHKYASVTFTTFSTTFFNLLYSCQQHFDALMSKLEHEMRAESFFAVTSGSA